VKNKLIVWFKKYEKYWWVKTGEYIGYWGIFPNYAPAITKKRLCVCFGRVFRNTGTKHDDSVHWESLLKHRKIPGRILGNLTK
jgi:hypothetical protein